MPLNDQNAQAIARGSDRVTSYLSHFSRGGSWDDWSVGKSVEYLEMLKVDLVMMASTIETRLQELYAVEPIDYGT